MTKGKLPVSPLKIDPMVIDMPQFSGKFSRFCLSKDKKRLFVIYEIIERKT